MINFAEALESKDVCCAGVMQDVLKSGGCPPIKL